MFSSPITSFNSLLWIKMLSSNYKFTRKWKTQTLKNHKTVWGFPYTFIKRYFREALRNQVIFEAVVETLNF